jgi:hypothetical protein
MWHTWPSVFRTHRSGRDLAVQEEVATLYVFQSDTPKMPTYGVTITRRHGVARGGG